MYTVTQAPQSTKPLRLYKSDGSRDMSVPPPQLGEAIMFRLPSEVKLRPPSVISSAVTGANGSNYHLCFVSGRMGGSSPKTTKLELWVCLGFSSARVSPNEVVLSLSPRWQEYLLPVPFETQPTPVLPLPTPPAFGTPLQIGGFLAKKSCFLSVRPVTVDLKPNSAFKRFTPAGSLTQSEALRLEQYAQHLEDKSSAVEDHDGSSTTGNHHHTSDNASPSDSGLGHHGDDQPGNLAPPETTSADTGDWGHTTRNVAVLDDDSCRNSQCSSGDSYTIPTFLEFAHLFSSQIPSLKEVIDKERDREQEACRNKVLGWMDIMEAEEHQ